jgi:peptide deformylase
MAIRKVARLGHPVLRQVGRQVAPEEIGSPALEQLIEDMIETMHEYDGIGLAAPQVHESLQLAVIEFDAENPRYAGMGVQPLQVFINPVITVLDTDLQGFWEGCLSIPELRGLVFRPKKVKVDFLDRTGAPCSFVAEGFLATVVQHELDHLDGTLFVDRIRMEPGKSPLAFTDEFQRFGPIAGQEAEGELDD